MHYIIIIAIIITIVLIQLNVYNKTTKKINVFGGVFAPSANAYSTKKDRENALLSQISQASVRELMQMLKTNGLPVSDFMIVETVKDETGAFINKERFNSEKAKNELKKRLVITESIFSNHCNIILTEIVGSINNYLSNNKGNVSDFHLMKDVVDRNCDSVEEEINAQVPVPLYLGLMGTMIGILVGIGYLWISGDLSALLSSSSTSGAEGVNALLGGVALAMISSILGILLTTLGSMKAKTAKVQTEKNKHVFLSWIQANLLPTLSNDTAKSIERMSQNLVEFNKTFSSNTDDLRSTLGQVNQATVLQKQLLEAVAKINDKKLVAQNLELYNVLQKSTGEIEKLASFLHDSTEYLNEVRKLNEKLDKNDQRAKAIEDMLRFFKLETAQIEQRKLAISKAVGEVDDKLEEQLRRLGDHASANVDIFYKALGKQQDALQSKLNETQTLITEIKNLTSIKEGISKFEKATLEQNRKIDNLSHSIEKLAELKVTGANEAESVAKIKTPLWKRLLQWTLPIIAGLLVLILLIANWQTIYYYVITLFRF